MLLISFARTKVSMDEWETGKLETFVQGTFFILEFKWFLTTAFQKDETDSQISAGSFSILTQPPISA